MNMVSVKEGSFVGNMAKKSITRLDAGRIKPI